MKQRVLILCTGNSARSQMTEGLLRYYAGDQFDVYSAGLVPKGVNPFAIQAMADRGIDISRHTSNSMREFQKQPPFDYVITVCDHADGKCPSSLWSNGKKLFWPFEDPADYQGSDEEILAKFIEVRDLIDVRLRGWLDEQQLLST